MAESRAEAAERRMWNPPIRAEDFSVGYDIPLEEVNADMIIIHESLKELIMAVRVMKSDEDFDYEMCRHAMFRVANIFMAYPRPDGDHNYMAMTPATSVYLLGEDDEYTNFDIKI